MRKIGKDGKDRGVVGEGCSGDGGVSEPGWVGLNDGLGWVVVGGGVALNGGGFVVARSAPVGPPVALTLALSRGARSVHNVRHSGESRNPEGPGKGKAHVI